MRKLYFPNNTFISLEGSTPPSSASLLAQYKSQILENCLNKSKQNIDEYMIVGTSMEEVDHLSQPISQDLYVLYKDDFYELRAKKITQKEQFDFFENLSQLLDSYRQKQSVLELKSAKKPDPAKVSILKKPSDLKKRVHWQEKDSSGKPLGQSQDSKLPNCNSKELWVIQRIKRYAMGSPLNPYQLATVLGVNVQLVRLMLELRDLDQTQAQLAEEVVPFWFLQYKFCPKQNFNMTQQAKRQLVLETIANPAATYEARIANYQKYKLQYHQMKLIFKEENMDSSQYKEKLSFLKSKVKPTSFQIHQLIALELANLKSKNHQVVYIDLIKASLDCFQLKLDKLLELKQQDEVFNPCQQIYILVAIEERVGLVGYQLLSKFDEQQVMLDFLQKVNEKLDKHRAIAEAAPEKRQRVYVLFNHSMNRQLPIVYLLAKFQAKMILMEDDAMNQNFNAAVTLWSYLIVQWDALEYQEQLSDAVATCLEHLSNEVVKALASQGNNDVIYAHLKGQKTGKKPKTYYEQKLDAVIREKF